MATRDSKREHKYILIAFLAGTVVATLTALVADRDTEYYSGLVVLTLAGVTIITLLFLRKKSQTESHLYAQNTLKTDDELYSDIVSGRVDIEDVIAARSEDIYDPRDARGRALTGKALADYDTHHEEILETLRKKYETWRRG